MFIFIYTHTHSHTYTRKCVHITDGKITCSNVSLQLLIVCIKVIYGFLIDSHQRFQMGGISFSTHTRLITHKYSFIFPYANHLTVVTFKFKDYVSIYSKGFFFFVKYDFPFFSQDLIDFY